MNQLGRCTQAGTREQWQIQLLPSGTIAVKIKITDQHISDVKNIQNFIAGSIETHIKHLHCHISCKREPFC